MDVEEAIERARIAANEIRMRQREGEATAKFQSQRRNTEQRDAQAHAESTRRPISLHGLTAARKRKRVSEDAAGQSSLPPIFEPSTLVRDIKKTNQNPDTDAHRTSEDEKKDDIQGPYAPPRKAPRGKATTVWTSKEQVETRISAKTSEWYNSVNMKEKYSRSDVQSVVHARDLIQNCITAVKLGGDSERCFDVLRQKIHEMEFFPFLSAVIIKKSLVLEDKGLPLVFDNQDGIKFPYDIRCDAENLYLRWIVGDFDPHLLRGVDTTKGQLQSGMKRISHKLTNGYAQKKSSNVVGENNLFNGQWWPNRLCALRDGAHGEQEAGIHGQMGKGAYSVVVASGGYADKDRGTTIEYCGTASETSTPTKSTLLLLETYRNKNPVRVLRAENKNSQYAPKMGIRYDGLYDVAGKEVLDETTAMYRFTLHRVSGQNPIRYQGVEERPTSIEKAEMVKIRKLLGMLK